MKLAVTYLTRKCNRRCTYCKLRESIGKELFPSQWVQIFKILKDLGVEFNLCLGNDCWLLGRELPAIMKHSPPYGLYTSCDLNVFDRLYKHMFDNGIYSFSCGADFPPSFKNLRSQIGHKSEDAAHCFRIVRKEYPKVDCQATFTLSRKSFRNFPKYVREYSKMGVNIGAGVLQWDTDGQFDFASKKSEMSGFLFRPQDKSEFLEIVDEALSVPSNTLALPELLKLDYSTLMNLDWHCKGDPIGGPCIDANGKLRVCGYRKGNRTNQMSIYDLPSQLDLWKENVYLDAKDCPGCLWSCSWMYHYHKSKECGIEHIKRDGYKK